MEDYKKPYKQTQRKMKEFIKRWDGIKLSSNDLFTEELKQIVEIENEDERVRKEIIETFKILGDGKIPVDINYADIFTWLEKQGETSTILSNSSNIGNVTLSEEEQNRFAKCVLTSCASSFIDYLDAHKYEGKMCVSNGECEDIENAFHNAMWDRLHRYYCKYIEKQGEQKQKQYDIDILEKHITKDSISELAHTVIVRNGWEIVDAKEQKTAWSEKQGEEKIFDKAESMKHSYITTNSEFFQWIYDRLKYVYNENPNVDYMLSLKERIEDMQKFANKIEPKFKVGDWIIDNKNRVGIIVRILDEHYIISFDGREVQISFEWEGKLFRKWTIQDAKDGDILATDDGICIFDGTVEEGKYPFAYCGITERGFGSYDVKLPFSHDNNVHPATKEQRDTLMKAMADAGWEFDFEKKKLRKIDQKSYGQMEKCIDCQFNYTGYCNGTCILKNNEQKSADNAEPKFKVGEWVVDKNGTVQQILSYKNGIYKHTNGYSSKMFEDEWRLWDITKDAKDGDVLAVNKDDVILIFRGIGNEEWNDVIDYYCRYDCYQKEFIVQKDLEFWGYIKDNQLKPATKEQCDTLMKAMADAGWKFDFENKELKKIPNALEECEIEHIEHGKYYYCIKDYYSGGNKRVSKGEVIQALRGMSMMALGVKANEYFIPVKCIIGDRCDWSEEDDVMVNDILRCLPTKSQPEYNQKRANWIKSLKDKVQPKHEWSEEDETNSYHLKILFENLAKDIKYEFRIISDNDRDKYTTWLESIKERYTWKPSEEQMKVLDEVLNFAANHESPYWNYYIFETLNNLIRQLKKLKGE